MQAEGSGVEEGRDKVQNATARRHAHRRTVRTALMTVTSFPLMVVSSSACVRPTGRQRECAAVRSWFESAR